MNHITAMRIDPDQMDKITNYANFMGITKAAVLREAIDSFMEVQAEVRMEVRLEQLQRKLTTRAS